MSQFNNASLFTQQLSRHHLTTFSHCDSTIETSSLFIYKKLRHDFQFNLNIVRRQIELLRTQIMKAKMIIFSQNESSNNFLKDF